MSKERKKVRPRAAARMPLSLRVTPTVRNALTMASHQMGRSISQEAETRLELSFYFENLLPDVVRLAYGDRIGGLLLAIGDAMQEAVRRASEDVDHPWHESPWDFDQVIEAVIETLRLARPEGVAVAPEAPPSDESGLLDMLHNAKVNYGQPAAAYKAKDIVAPPEVDPRGVRHAASIREMLGPQIVERITSRVKSEKQT